MKKQLSPFILWFSEIGLEDLEEVGGKNASLGEMLKYLKPRGIQIPEGFATTTHAYRDFLSTNKLETPIAKLLSDYKAGTIPLEAAGQEIRNLIQKSTFPTHLAESIREAYVRLGKQYGKENIDVAVRSSATAEDLPGASFAGQQETFLNILGESDLMRACKSCYASLFTNRAISYRENRGFDHVKVSLSIGVQKMVRADKSCSGVMFTVDTETGFPDSILINGSWGLGENVVKGTVNPDQFYVFKPVLGNSENRPILEKIMGSKEIKMVYTSNEGSHTENIPTTIQERRSFVLDDDEILKLAGWGVAIESHYNKPMDIEWVKDDDSGELFIVQARPETVHSIQTNGIFQTYKLSENNPTQLLTGLSIGGKIVSGKVKVINDTTSLSEIDQHTILVTEMTEPDWVPALKNAAGIVTDFGGRTCHAAIVSRELGIPAVVGTKNATKTLTDGQEITISSAEGEEGKVYEGLLKFRIDEIKLDLLPETKTNIMLNLATPESAFKWWRLPVKGVGLARMEFIIANHIRIHPMALVHPDRIENEDEYRKIRKLTQGYEDAKEYFVEKLASGISKIAASQYPNPVIVRTSDFKTNEYASLIGGSYFEPKEENPMLGWRGASRYYSKGYSDGFAMECKALKRAREVIGLDNIVVMIPFCRTLGEVQSVLEVMEENGLKRGTDGLQIYMMCEVPSNYILAEEFAKFFDGFSIGSNDLTQLILGVDRDAGEMAHLFDENDPAVKTAIREVIQRAHLAGIKIGFCGQAPSDNPEYAAFLVDCNIDSISIVPDSVINVIEKVTGAERKNQKLITAKFNS